jgi:hypothetical protein
MTEAERELLQSYHHRSEIEYPIIGAVRYGGDPGISVILDAYAKGTNLPVADLVCPNLGAEIRPSRRRGFGG